MESQQIKSFIALIILFTVCYIGCKAQIHQHHAYIAFGGGERTNELDVGSTLGIIGYDYTYKETATIDITYLQLNKDSKNIAVAPGINIFSKQIVLNYSSGIIGLINNTKQVHWYNKLTLHTNINHPLNVMFSSGYFDNIVYFAIGLKFNLLFNLE